MEYAVPVILFLLGFTAFLLAGRGLRRILVGRRSAQISVDEGAVRLDKIVHPSQTRRRRR